MKHREQIRINIISRLAEAEHSDINELIKRIYKSEADNFWKARRRSTGDTSGDERKTAFNSKSKATHDRYRRKLSTQCNPITSTFGNKATHEFPRSFKDKFEGNYKNNSKYISIPTTNFRSANNSGNNTPLAECKINIAHTKKDLTSQVMKKKSNALQKKMGHISSHRASLIIAKQPKDKLVRYNIERKRHSMDYPRVERTRRLKCNRNRLAHRSIVLDALIRECTEEEDMLGRKLNETHVFVNNTVEFAENYKKVSQKLDKLSFAKPNVLEYLYYKEKDESNEIEELAKDNIDKSKNTTIRKYLFGSSKLKKALRGLKRTHTKL